MIPQSAAVNSYLITKSPFSKVAVVLKIVSQKVTVERKLKILII